MTLLNTVPITAESNSGSVWFSPSVERVVVVVEVATMRTADAVRGFDGSDRDCEAGSAEDVLAAFLT